MADSPREALDDDGKPLIERQFNAARRELDQLLSRLLEQSEDEALGQEAATALATTLEELEVTAEELRAQNDELVATRQQSELLQSRYRSLFDLAPEPYIVTDEVGVVREANVQAELLLGRKHGALVGKPMVLFVPEADRPDFRRRLWGISDLSLRGLDLRVCTKDGEVVPVTASVGPLVLPDGTRELRWVLSDASPTRLVREDLRRRLEARKHDVEALETVRDWQSTLLGAAAHDLRTPLAVVAGVIDTLLERSLPPEQQEMFLQKANGQTAKLLRILEGLMELGRRQLHDDRVHRELVVVTEVASVLLDPVLAGDHQIRVHADVEAWVDRTQLERILENLITNAIRHAPRSTEVDVWATMEDGDLILRVDDRGPGVAEELRELIFQPFVAADREESRNGSGLGLAIVAMFAQMHGGRAWVQDRPGGGASFRVLLSGAIPPVEGSSDDTAESPDAN